MEFNVYIKTKKKLKKKNRLYSSIIDVMKWLQFLEFGSFDDSNKLNWIRDIYELWLDCPSMIERVGFRSIQYAQRHWSKSNLSDNITVKVPHCHCKTIKYDNCNNKVVLVTMNCQVV